MNNHSTESQRLEKKSRFPFRVNSSQHLKLVGLFTLMGVLGGYLYYSLIGCNSGGCAITSNPYLSMLWGGAMGYFLVDFIIKKEKKEN